MRAWSPDGRDVVFTTNLTDGANLWKVSAAGGFPIQLLQSDDRKQVRPGRGWKVDCLREDFGGAMMTCSRLKRWRRGRESHQHAGYFRNMRRIGLPMAACWLFLTAEKTSSKSTLRCSTGRQRSSQAHGRAN